jgi:hypothetical protein
MKRVTSCSNNADDDALALAGETSPLGRRSYQSAHNVKMDATPVGPMWITPPRASRK